MGAREEIRRAMHATGQAAAYVAVVLLIVELARREHVTSATVLSPKTFLALAVFWAVAAAYRWIRMRLDG